ncbi:MAG: outer membrane beta-barrel protein [Deltaproteobacteria bacterium]|nr:outer membrane beta-barrel protein [Deltaproteobacteria bacterium]
MRCTLTIGSLVAGLLVGGTALAQEANDASKQVTSEPSKGGAVLLGARVGGLVTFGGMNPNARAGIELGYIFPWMNRSFAAALDIDYAAPKQAKTVDADPRVPGGSYAWHLTEKQLAFMPVFMYRLTSLGRVVPYAGIGPRIYLLRSTVRGAAAGNNISETTEQSTKIGFGVPLGAEFQLGPGGLLAEALLEYGPLDHSATGNSNTGAATLMLGYRFIL